MNSNLKLIVVAVVVLGVGLVVGRMIGAAEVYKKTSGELAEQYYRGAAANLKSHLALLKLMDAHREQEVTQNLERLVDVDILAFRRASAEATKLPPEVSELIRQAEQYRQRQPSHAPKK